MKEIITNEFIQYKTGFINGKNEIIEAFKLGKIISLNEQNQEADFETSYWYDNGYKDGFAYFSNLIDENKLDLEKINTNEIIKLLFNERVIKINKEEGKNIPIGKFKM